MATPSITTTVREILTATPDLPADDVIKQAKANGLDAADQSIRNVIYNIRSEINKKNRKPKKVAAPAAAATPKPKPKAPAAAAPPVAAAAAPLVTASNLAGVLATVAEVHRVIGLCGGLENARHAAEVVQACGGIDAFLQHVNLVADISAAGVAK